MALVGGEPLIAHAVKRLAGQGFIIAINAPEVSGAAKWARDHGLAVVGDSAADPVGPLAGVKAGLVWADRHGIKLLATSPCDTPFLPADLETVLAASLTADAKAATARSPSGLQSLCTVWRRQALPVLEQHFDHGHHPAVHDLLAELGGVEVMFNDDAPFANLNRAGDFPSPGN